MSKLLTISVLNWLKSLIGINPHLRQSLLPGEHLLCSAFGTYISLAAPIHALASAADVAIVVHTHQIVTVGLVEAPWIRTVGQQLHVDVLPSLAGANVALSHAPIVVQQTAGLLGC